MKATPLGLRLFLEGVEVPVISAQVMIQPDSPAAATIQVIPTDMGLSLLPRTLVHLFYLDTALTGKETAEVQRFEREHRGTVSIENNTVNRFEAADIYYKLLFCGEIIGLQFAKNPTSRQLVFQCMDLSSYWDACYQFFSDYSTEGSGLTDTTHQFCGANAGLFDNVAGDTKSVISQLLGTKPLSPEYQNCQGLQGGVIHLLEVVGGVKHRGPGVNAGYNGANDFFTIAELRYNLLGMLGAIAEDKTSAKLYANKAFWSWLQNGMTSLGSLLSFRDIVNHVNSYIFHNLYPNPCAYYVSAEKVKKNKTAQVDCSLFTESMLGRFILQELKRVHSTLGLANKKLQSAWDYGVFEDYREGIEAVRSCRTWLNQASATADDLKTDDKASVKAAILEILTKLKGVGTVGPAGWQAPMATTDNLEESSKVVILPEDQKITNEIDAIMEAFDLVEGLIGPQQRAKRTIRKTVEVEVGGHLYNQLFLPEVFWASPPRCNIIFPDQYFDFSYSRNFAREITRLSCQGGLGILAGGQGSGQTAKILGRHYFAPNIKDVRGKTLYATLSAGARVLLPHEVHSGIIPKFEWVTDGHRWGLKAAAGGKELKQITESQKINYIQRLANFQFFLHRWSSRSMSLAGIFMPHLVAGFPSVVIDRAAPTPAVLEAMEKELGRKMLPTQYMGKIVGLNHSVSQQGGSTAVSFAYCRTHRGLDDEFMGILNKEKLVLSKDKVLVINPKELALLPTSGGADRNLMLKLLLMHFKGILKPSTLRDVGKITKVTEKGTTSLRREEFLQLFQGSVADVILNANPGVNFSTKFSKAGGEGAIFDEFDAYRNANPGKMVLDRTSKQDIYGATEKAVSYPAEITVTYQTWVGTGVMIRSGASFEDVVRPEWMVSTVWDNAHITKAVYAPLLGTTAITDDVCIGQAEQDELLKRQMQKTKEGAPALPGTGAGSATTMPGDDSKLKYYVTPGSVEETIDGLAIVYGLIRSRGESVHEFIQQFVSRPVATLVDVMGSQNLEFGPDGMPIQSQVPGEDIIEGFHSRAFGDYNVNGKNSLAVLFPGERDPRNVKRPEVIDRKKPHESVNEKLDPRGRARARVSAYMAELRISRGLLSQ